MLLSPREKGKKVGPLQRSPGVAQKKNPGKPLRVGKRGSHPSGHTKKKNGGSKENPELSPEKG